jgi:2,3-bisphosphoglycerate-independent phosphoglycerate mutase
LDELARDINKIKIPGCDIIFKRSRGHRGVLILRGKDLSPNIRGTDPHQVGKKVLHSVGLGTGRDRSKTERAAKILNRFTELAYEILDGHAVNKMREIPANILLARHPSSVARMESFEHRWGLRAGCVAAVGDVIGAAKAIGIQTKQVGSGHINTDLAAKVRATKQMIKYKDFVLLHIKGADEAAHDRNFSAKKGFIERVDREVVDKVMRLKNTIIVVTTDHVTSCASGSHLPGLVPLLIYGAEGDEVKHFDEHACARGSLGIIKAEHLLERLLAFRK